MKKKLLLALTTLFTLFVTAFTAQSVLADATISGSVKVWDNAAARQFRTSIFDGQTGSVPAGLSMLGYSDVPVYLFSTSDTSSAVQTTTTAGDGTYSFTGVADGTYVVAIASQTATTQTRHAIIGLSGIESNGNAHQTDTVSQPIVVSGGTVTIAGPTNSSGDVPEQVVFGVVRWPYALHLLTTRGNFVVNTSSGTSDIGTTVSTTDSSGAAVNAQLATIYEGGTTYFEQNGTTFISLKGVLASDTLGHITSELLEPTLSAEDVADGWVFSGWVPEPFYSYTSSYDSTDSRTMIERYPTLVASGTLNLLTTSQVLAIQAQDDMAFRAVFTQTTHTVTFVTDTDKGTINDGASTSTTYAGNTKTVGSDTIPTPAAKAGYTFVGWYTDLSTNIISTDDIASTVVNKDLTYYAKYVENTSTTPTVVNGINGNTIKTVPGTNDAGESGIWVITYDADGNEIDRQFIRDGLTADLAAKVKSLINGTLPRTGEQLSLTFVVFGLLGLATVFGLRFRKK